MKRLIQYICFLKKVSIIQFFYLNYFSKNIIRKDKSKIIPYKHSVIELEKNTKVFLSNGDIEIGCDRLKKSKTETIIRIKNGAEWKSVGGCKVSYGCTIEIFANAVFESKYFTMNCNSVAVISNRISFGHDVMIGRNVVIYDSDFHQILNENKEVINQSRPVEIGDHVWLGVNVTVLKGSVIGSGSVIGAQTVINGRVGADTIYQTKREGTERSGYGSWNRKYPNLIGEEGYHEE